MRTKVLRSEIRATFLPVDSITFFTACSWSKELWEITHIHVPVMLKHTGEANMTYWRNAWKKIEIKILTG